VIAYLSVEQVLELHRVLIDRFGGSDGVRDRGAIESAVARPAMTFDGEDLYPDLPTKAAALMHSLVANHPFVDGNKRAGIAAAELMVVLNGYALAATNSELEDLTLKTARGEMDVGRIGIWFGQRTTPRD
jgi:death-on-curing protein